jgi:hypothetical protein
MGWKNVKQHYDIRHIVKIVDGRLFIGSPYISDLIVVEPDGTVTKTVERRRNDALTAIHDSIAADPATFRHLLATPDNFERSIPVFTYEGSDIIEKECEEYGWPNLTHDGCLMYENSFFAERADAVERAFENARAGVRLATRSVAEAQKTLDELKALLKSETECLERLEAIYPGQP